MDIKKKTHDVDKILLDYYQRKAGKSTHDVAEALGISDVAYRNKKNGKSPFLVVEMFMLCDLLDIPDDGTRSRIFYPQ